MTEKKTSRFGLYAVIITAIALLIFTLCTFQVRVNEVALISTMGKLGKEPHEAGAGWKAPWPFQKVIKCNTSLQVFEGTYEENLTADDKTLILTIFALWRVDDPYEFLTKPVTVDNARAKLADLIRNERRQVISAHPINHLISSDPKVRQFDAVEQEILTRVQEALDKGRYGIRIETLGIEQLRLSSQITKDVFDRMASERRIKAEEIRQKGILEAGRIRAQARVDGGKIEADAKEQAKKIRSEGDLAAARKYEVFEQDKEFAVFLREIESLETILAKKTTLVIDRDAPPFSLLKGEFLNRPANDGSHSAPD